LADLILSNSNYITISSFFSNMTINKKYCNLKFTNEYTVKAGNQRFDLSVRYSSEITD